MQSWAKGTQAPGGSWRNPFLHLVHDFVRIEDSVPVCPSSSVVAVAAEQNSELHRLQHHPVTGLKCPHHSGSWMELFFIFTSRKRELDPCYLGNQQS